MSGAHDFDFNTGEWVVTNRRLKTRGAGVQDWEAFVSHVRAQVLMCGLISIDENEFPTKGFWGTTFRHYEPAQDQWSIYWLNSADGVLQPPVRGRFKDGRGVFAGDDMDGERPVKVLFDWSRTDTPTPRWSQAFSYDGGETWETNWVMEFRRPER